MFAHLSTCACYYFCFKLSIKLLVRIAMFKSFLNKSHEVRVLGPLLLRSFHSTALLLEPPDGMLSSPMGIGQGAQPLSHWLWFPAISPFVDGTFWRFFRNDIATYTKHQVAQSCCDEIFIFRSWRWSYAFARPVRAWTGQNIWISHSWKHS